MTQIYIKQNIHKHQTQNPRRTSPPGITPVEKAHKARTRRHRGPLRRLINTRFKNKYKKGMERSNNFFIYKCMTANTSAIWQHAAYAIDQLTSPSC